MKLAKVRHALKKYKQLSRRTFKGKIKLNISESEVLEILLRFRHSRQKILE